MQPSQAYDRSYFERQSSRSYQSARVILSNIFERLQPQRIIDVGCGIGAWLRAAKELGATEILGIDGDYMSRSMLLIDPTFFVPADLATQRVPELLGERAPTAFDLAISVEVAEHLPYTRAASFVEDLAALGDVILFSAAVPYQYGVNHINEQWPEFWAILFRSHGFSCFDWVRPVVWGNPDVDWWYAQNAFIFVRDGSLASSLVPAESRVVEQRLSLIHPENFLTNVLQFQRKHRLVAFQEEVNDYRTLIKAHEQQASVLPRLQTLERALAVPPESREVFPWTRSELVTPEEERQLLDQAAALHRTRTQLNEARTQTATLRLQVDEILRSTTWQWARMFHAMARRLPRRLQQIVRGTAQRCMQSAIVSRLQKTLFAPEASHTLTPAATATDNDAAQGLQHRVSTGMLAMAVDRLRDFCLFQERDYLQLHPDVKAAGADPYSHFVGFGSFEHRQLCKRDHIARILGKSAQRGCEFQPLQSPFAAYQNQPPTIPDRIPRIGIYANSRGNVFMKEIAADLVADLRQAQVPVEAHDEMSSPEDRPPLCIFVAPHEFFTLGRGKEWIHDDVLSSSFMFTTEQVQTAWFGLSLPFALMARGVIDISLQTASMFCEASIPALHLEPGARPASLLTDADQNHPLYRVLPGAARTLPDSKVAFSCRPIDISFFGAESPRREAFFARNARSLADYETFLYYRRQDRGPMRAQTDEGALTRIAAHVCGHSKISLNLHREEFAYFEWHRIVRLGMCSGSVVVSEPCLPHPHFKPGTHYFEETARHIPDLLEWLLRSKDGEERAEQVRQNTSHAIASASNSQRISAKLVDFLLTSRHINIDRRPPKP